MRRISAPLFFRPLFICSLLLGSGPLLGLPSDRDQPIEVDADRAVREAELVTYLGNVVISQGSMRINADKVVVTSAGSQVQRIVASGEPARLQQNQTDNQPMRAAANTIDYRLTDETIVLTEQASIRNEGSEVLGQRIEYELQSQTVRADGEGSGRVRMVLQPQEKPTEPQP